MTKSTFLVFLALLFILSACSLPISNPTPSGDSVATQVSQILTSMPSSSPVVVTPQASETAVEPSPIPTSTSVNPTATLPEPTQVPPTSTATESPSPTATSTTAPTATLAAGDPLAKLGNPTWQDTFANDLNWPTGDNEFTSIDIQNNQMVLTALSKLDGWRLSYPTVQNFYLEAVLKSDNCSGPDHYGVIVRVPDPKTADNGYLFGITCDGQYSIRKWNGTKMTNLVGWANSDSIKTGSGVSNRLGVLAVGSQLTIYINGVKIASTQDSSYSQGYFGVFVGGNNTPNLAVIVSSIAFWEDPQL